MIYFNVTIELKEQFCYKLAEIIIIMFLVVGRYIQRNVPETEAVHFNSTTKDMGQ